MLSVASECGKKLRSHSINRIYFEQDEAMAILKRGLAVEPVKILQRKLAAPDDASSESERKTRSRAASRGMD